MYKVAIKIENTVEIYQFKNFVNAEFFICDMITKANSEGLEISYATSIG